MAKEVEELFADLEAERRRDARGLRHRRPAGRRRLHGVVARRAHRGRAGRLPPLPAHASSASCSSPTWSAAALHRPAEFNKSHIPAFLADEEPKDYICVYPFVRSYEWYLLDDKERRDMLREHGQMARDYPDVRANTIASFALNDYEWVLAFEADELHRIVDLMRELRASRARMHVREEVPFHTGRRVEVRDLLQSLR